MEFLNDDYGMSEKQGTSNESSKAASKLSPPKATSGPVFMVDEDNRRMRHVSDTTERRAREERDKETEVERRRREAVFGTSKDSDDEDEPLIIPPPFPETKANNQNPHPMTKTTNKRVPTKRPEVKVVPVEQKVQEVERNYRHHLLFELVGYDSVILMLAKRVFHWKRDHRVRGPDIIKLVVKIGV